MLEIARSVLPTDRVELRTARLQDPLPDGPFDVVLSALAVHHLDGLGKRSLFSRVAAVLPPGGRFVMGDVVVPTDPQDAVVPLDESYDLPDTLADILAWLRQAGLEPSVIWERADLAVVVAEAPR
jgi:tRNA (cmo5U34)-methyltransferase